MTHSSNPKFSNIARPYALAAFEVARDKKTLDAWKAFLASASEVAENKTVAKLLSNPEVSDSKLVEVFQSVLTTLLDEDRKNFLMLLAQNKRLQLLPEIATLFNSYYAYLEKISAVRVITAVDIEDDFRQKLINALSKRMDREVTLQTEVDPEIIGGAIIHIGDRVIDGSIRGQLTRLLQNLTG